MNVKFNENIFYKFPFLESERLIFKSLGKMDAAGLFLIRSNEEVMKYMDTTALDSLKSAQTLISFFNNQFRNKTAITWGMFVKAEKKLIGSFSFWKINKPHCRAEIGYSIRPDFWGNGFMTETFKTLIEFGFSQMGLHSIEANVNPQNNKSIRLLERIGFKKEACFRENFFFNEKYLDSVIYCLLETDHRDY
jgi:[ribosomal protein S5]-alanine N-acetyltransferase